MPSVAGDDRTGTVLLQLLDPEYPEGPAAEGPVVRVKRWWYGSEGPQRQRIAAAVTHELVLLLRKPKRLAAPDQTSIFLSLAQLVVELALDEQAAPILYRIALLGRASGAASAIDPEVEERLLAFMAALGKEDWIPLWRDLWKRADADLWPVAFSGILNADPSGAARMLPELIQREMTGPDRAFLIHRLLTDTVGWPDVAASWSHAEAAATAAVETILSDEYGEPLEGDVRRGLDELRAALADAPAARGGANIRIGGMDLTAADVKMEKRYPLPGQTGRIPLSLLTA